MRPTSSRFAMVTPARPASLSTKAPMRTRRFMRDEAFFSAQGTPALRYASRCLSWYSPMVFSMIWATLSGTISGVSKSSR